MAAAPAYRELLDELRHTIGVPKHGIVLLEFGTIPQLEIILAELRAIDPARPIVEVKYDPPRENAGLYLRRATELLAAAPPAPLPLLILRPETWPDLAEDTQDAVDFWRSLNFRRETIGDLPAQVLLCLDSWHLDRALDYAADLLSWAAPKYRLVPSDDSDGPRPEALASFNTFAHYDIAPEAAQRRWATFWPLLLEKHTAGPLQPSDLREFIFPLLEASLSQGNLVQSRQVRDIARGMPIPEDDVIRWHYLNGQLAIAAQEPQHAFEHASKLLHIVRHAEGRGMKHQALVALIILATLLSDFGAYTQAERILWETQALAENVLGPEHPDTLMSVNNLALLLKTKGDFAGAEPLYRRALEATERTLGTEHPYTLSSMNNLAGLLDSKGDFAGAEPLFRRVLDARERTLGPEHRQTLTSVNNLAALLQATGDLARAEPLFLRAFEVSERTLGPEHPKTVGAMHNLAALLQAKGDLVRAEALFLRALEASERTLGLEHPFTLSSVNNLALLLYANGDLEGAELFFRRALEGRRRILGEWHLDTSLSAFNLALFLVEQQRGEEALPLARQAYEGWMRSKGENHQDTQSAAELLHELEAK